MESKEMEKKGGEKKNRISLEKISNIPMHGDML